MNEITRFIQKNQRTIGIIALIIFAIGVYSKNQGVDIPFFSGSILGGFQSFGLSFGVILFLIGIALGFAQQYYIAFPLMGAGALLAGGTMLTSITSFLDVISRPMVAVILGILFLFLIFRKKGRR